MNNLSCSAIYEMEKRLNNLSKTVYIELLFDEEFPIEENLNDKEVDKSYIYPIGGYTTNINYKVMLSNQKINIIFNVYQLVVESREIILHEKLSLFSKKVVEQENYSTFMQIFTDDSICINANVDMLDIENLQELIIDNIKQYLTAKMTSLFTAGKSPLRRADSYTRKGYEYVIKDQYMFSFDTEDILISRRPNFHINIITNINKDIHR